MLKLGTLDRSGASDVALEMRDSASAKIAVVVGIGAIAFGIAALRGRLAGPPVAPRPDHTSSVTPVLTLGGAGGDSRPSEAPPQNRPIQGAHGATGRDRIKLMEAAQEGDLARVEALFTKGANLDGTLGQAAQSGNASLVTWLLAHGVDAKEDEDLSVPPLLMADEHPAVVQILLSKGAHEPALAKAVAAGKPKAVARLLSRGESASSKADGEPVLMLAIRSTDGAKRRALVDVLLNAGAEANVKYDDETALEVAVTHAAARDSDEEKPGNRPLDLVGRLIAKGARVDIASLTTALGADDTRRAALVDALLAGTRDQAVLTLAVGVAAQNHDAASLKKIASHGCSWGTLEGGSNPPLRNAIAASDVPMVKAILDAGAPVDRLGEEGDTALLAAVAAASGDSDDALRVVRVLLERGASPNKRGQEGRTPLFAAAQQGSETLAALLVSKGARVDDAVDGMTPLEAADSRGHDTIVKLLKARGAKKKKVAVD